MFFRKNKERKHTCSLCGHSRLNTYYGIKSYEEIPLYAFEFYNLYKTECVWCKNDFYYLTKIG